MRSNASNLRTLANRTAQYNVQPDPPRGLKFKDGILSWERPRSGDGLTHFNIYANTESNLVRRVPAGQLTLQDNLTADRVFVSSFNVYGEKESALVALLEQVAPVAPSSGTGGDTGWNNLTPNGSNEVTPDMSLGVVQQISWGTSPVIIKAAINGTDPLIAGRIIRIRFVRASTGAAGVITWNAFYRGIGEREPSIEVNSVSWFTFIIRPDNKAELCNEIIRNIDPSS